jgi:hypothetical protein
MITPAQCRAARALLDWSQMRLAESAHFGVVTIRLFEGGGRTRDSTVVMLHRALETAGVIFVDGNGEGPGVRLRKGVITPEAEPTWRPSGQIEIPESDK